MDSVGKPVLGDLRVVRLVGEGDERGAGKVIRAWGESGRWLAWKVWGPRAAQDREGRRDAWGAKVVADARKLVGHGHAQIVDVLEAGQLSDGSPYLWMEWVAGQSLRDWFGLRTRLSPAHTLHVVAEVAEGLSAMHARGVVHGGLCPARVRVRQAAVPPARDDRRLEVVLVGLGAPVRAPWSTPTAELSYVAPELARAAVDGAALVDPRTDVYGLAALAYELVSGRPPYLAGNLGALVAEQLVHRPPSLLELAPDVPDAWPGVLLAALAPRPEDRPATPRALLELLGASAAGNPWPSGRRRTVVDQGSSSPARSAAL